MLPRRAARAPHPRRRSPLGLGAGYVALGARRRARRPRRSAEAGDGVRQRAPLRRASASRRASTARPGSARPPATDALWVLEQPGRVVRLDGGRRTSCSTSRDRVTPGAEQGLLGIAFHPDFATDRPLYLHWSDRKGDTRVAEFRAAPDGTIEPEPAARAARTSTSPRRTTTAASSPFGPDGRLYLGLGDGGGAFDPRRTAQDPRDLLGKLARRRRRRRRSRAGRSCSPACATPGASRSTPRSARSGSATSARTRSRRSTASCSSPTSRRRTSAGAPSRAPQRSTATTSTGAGELVLPGRHLHARRRLLGHRRRRLRAAPRCRSSAAATSTATSARARCGRCRPRPEGRADRRPPRAGRGPAAHAHRHGRRRRAAVRLRRPARSTARCPPAPA